MPAQISTWCCCLLLISQSSLSLRKGLSQAEYTHGPSCVCTAVLWKPPTSNLLLPTHCHPINNARVTVQERSKFRGRKQPQICYLVKIKCYSDSVTQPMPIYKYVFCYLWGFRGSWITEILRALLSLICLLPDRLGMAVQCYEASPLDLQ